MIAEPLHVPLSLNLVSWRANLWADERGPNEHATVEDDPFTLRKPEDEDGPRDDASGPPHTEPSRFVRQPVRVIFTPRRTRNA